MGAGSLAISQVEMYSFGKGQLPTAVDGSLLQLTLMHSQGLIKACKSRWERREVLALGWMLSTDIMNGFSQHGGCFTHSHVRKSPSEPRRQPPWCASSLLQPPWACVFVPVSQSVHLPIAIGTHTSKQASVILWGQ